MKIGVFLCEMENGVLFLCFSEPNGGMKFHGGKCGLELRENIFPFLGENGEGRVVFRDVGKEKLLQNFFVSLVGDITTVALFSYHFSVTNDAYYGNGLSFTGNENKEIGAKGSVEVNGLAFFEVSDNLNAFFVELGFFKEQAS